MRVPAVGVTVVRAEEAGVHAWTHCAEVPELVIDETAELAEDIASQVTCQQWGARYSPGGFRRTDGIEEPHHVVGRPARLRIGHRNST
jgi:hypothetical protein